MPNDWVCSRRVLGIHVAPKYDDISLLKKASKLKILAGPRIGCHSSTWPSVGQCNVRRLLLQPLVITSLCLWHASLWTEGHWFALPVSGQAAGLPGSDMASCDEGSTPFFKKIHVCWWKSRCAAATPVKIPNICLPFSCPRLKTLESNPSDSLDTHF